MKSEMLYSLNRRFCSIADSQHLVLASMLEPCFKDKFFDGKNNKQKPKMLLEELRKLTGESVTVTKLTL